MRDHTRGNGPQQPHAEVTPGAWSPLPGVALGPRHVSETLGPLLHRLLLERLRHQGAETVRSDRQRAA